ncbi:MAG: energy-coupled thiamine transporter ThiT [Ruminococcus sp.]|nr:energy-coupled thiamine transporter ThiT [Ruminococcus sp.]
MDKFWKKRRGNRLFWGMLLFVVALLAYFLQPIRMFETPYKVGEVTMFSMLILCLIGYIYGPLWGFLSGFLFGGITYIADVLLGFSPFRFSEGLDYLLGYTVMGVCGLLAVIPRKDGTKRSLLFCYSCAAALRFAESVWIWSWFREDPVSPLNDLWYGVINCIGYLGIEYLLSLFLLLLPPTREVLSYIQRIATEKYTETYDFF